ncbi:MAG TPA: GTPase, partial [Hansschlegelia sp.]
DYPFTTLHPNLGVVAVDEREFVMADIPGLIEGAHEGVGLGDRFLGHVERCGVLLHLVDGTTDHAGEAYKIVRGELEAYGGGLAEKPEIVALSKSDSLSPELRKEQLARLKRAAKRTPIALSALSREAIDVTLRQLLAVIDETRAQEAAEAMPKVAAEAWRP